jgi:hypothetical protein
MEHSLSGWNMLQADGAIVPWGQYTNNAVFGKETNIVGIAAGPEVIFALRRDGSVFKFGGNRTPFQFYPIRTMFPHLQNPLALAGGTLQSLALPV